MTSNAKSCLFFEIRIARYTIGFFTIEFVDECDPEVRKLITNLFVHQNNSFYASLLFPSYLGTKIVQLVSKFALALGDFRYNDGSGTLDNPVAVGENIKHKTFFGSVSLHVNPHGKIESPTLSICLHHQPIMVFSKYVAARIKVGLELLSELESFPVNNKQQPKHLIYVGQCGFASHSQIKEFTQYNSKIQNYLLDHNLYLIDALVQAPQLFKTHELITPNNTQSALRFIENIRRNTNLNVRTEHFN